MHTLNRAASLVVVSVLTLATALQAQSFDILFRVIGDKESCQVKTPGSDDFDSVINGKAYPFGTIVRTEKGGEATVLLSAEDTVRMSAKTELTVSDVEGAPANTRRMIRLAKGRVDLSVRDVLPDNAVTLETAVASCNDFTGHCSAELSKIRKSSRDKLDLSLVVHADNGAVRVFGPQFSIPKMKAGSTVRIESSSDRSITRIVNEANEYKVNIDNDTDTPVASLDMNVRSMIRISREHAAVGGKLAVSVLATAPDGSGKESISFVPGEPALTVNGLRQTETHDGAAGSSTNAPAMEQSLIK